MFRERKRPFQLDHLRFVAGNLPLKESRFGSRPHIESDAVVKRIEFNEISGIENFVGSQRDPKVLCIFPIRKCCFD